MSNAQKVALIRVDDLNKLLRNLSVVESVVELFIPRHLGGISGDLPEVRSSILSAIGPGLVKSGTGSQEALLMSTLVRLQDAARGLANIWSQATTADLPGHPRVKNHG